MSAAPRPQPVYPGSTFTRTAFADALAIFYFGPGDPKDRFDRFIRRAYRDMNRTIRGLGSLDGRHRDALRRQGEEVLRHHLIAPTPAYARPWSRHDSYDEYLDFQRAVRERFGCGLDGEFMLWRPRFER
jgi:hypothetical protein